MWVLDDRHSQEHRLTRIRLVNRPAGEAGPLPVGDRVRLDPTHVDPTMSEHERAYVVSGTEVVDTWDIDLRNW